VLEQAWNSILKFTEQLVIPDWSALVALIPIGLFALTALWLLWTIRRFALAGPTQRGKRRLTPAPPAGVHAASSSMAPILAAIGTALLIAGLVAGGPLIVVGAIVLVLTLLYWGREGLRDYDHLANVEPLPPQVHGPAPHGIHMIGPSFRPILGALAVAVLFYGLVFGGWLLGVGVLLTVITLLGWLRDARLEYVEAVTADQTGHIEPLPAPKWPTGLVWAGAILVVGALVLNLGLLPPKSSTAGGPGDSGEPPASGGAGPSGSGGLGGPGADISVTAESLKFSTAEIKAPADKPFKIAFDNKDAGIQHDIAILDPKGALLFNGGDVTGPKVETYDVTPLPAGTYKFICTFHTNMTGQLTAG
jgi:plastocyanin